MYDVKIGAYDKTDSYCAFVDTGWHASIDCMELLYTWLYGRNGIASSRGSRNAQ